MSALFNEPVRAHYKDHSGVAEPCLWIGMTSKDEALVVMGDGSIEVSSVDFVTADWRWTGTRWEDLQEAIEGVDPDGT